MSTLFFTGVILPERAQLSQVAIRRITHVSTGREGNIHIRILNNQLTVKIDIDGDDLDIFTLRNLVKNAVQNQLSIIGYVFGYAYELEISRVFDADMTIDYVFGIDIPCLSARVNEADRELKVAAIDMMTYGPRGIFINRCLTDLAFAMKHADDTAFYCYRAIESLFHHRAASLEVTVTSRNKAVLWEGFRAEACCNEDAIRFIKSAADPLRHGNVASESELSREILFGITWDVVDGYFNHLITSEPSLGGSVTPKR